MIYKNTFNLNYKLIISIYNFITYKIEYPKKNYWWSMFKLSFSRKALKYIIQEQKKNKSEQLVVVLFYHSAEK